MNENCANFRGPSMDSSKYAVWYCLLSFEKVSRGDWAKGIFLKLIGSTSLVVVCVIVGCCEPKAIPHFQCAPYGSQQYA